ncbi:MAG: hypothetical protein FWH05_04350 [Oscillospiraceae bacterium]|nr:hypothetical protein [Oscillospiraceae bacterium]
MQNEKIAEIISKKGKRVAKYKFNRQLKNFERQLKFNIVKNLTAGLVAGEWRLAQKEIRMLMTRDKEVYISVSGDTGLPVVGELLDGLMTDEINENTVCECIDKASRTKYIPSMDIDNLVWAAKFSVINRYIKQLSASVADGTQNPEPKISDMAARLGRFAALDESELTLRLNPLEKIYSDDSLYPKMTAETKALYRKMSAQTAIATDRDEDRMAREYLIRCKENEHVGKLIFSEYRNIFPFANPVVYTLVIGLSAAALSAVVGFFFGVLGGMASFFPIMAAIKPIVDLSITKTARVTAPIPAMKLSGDIPKNAKTLCCISTLLSNKGDATAGLKKLKAVREKNHAKNLTYCLLCDLPPSDSSAEKSDNGLIYAAKEAFEGQDDFVILIRERVYSKTQRTWQGDERKRGAILALAELLRKKQRKQGGFRAIYGDLLALEDVKYILALDYDTLPLMDSVSELVGIALHPLSQGKGIIAPRMSTTLTSYLKTGFSRAMTANGGTAGASTYDSFAGEMYQDCFGEGIFTGKGLIDVDIFAECFERDFQNGRKDFPPERILSHDILEGGHMGVIYAGNVEFSDSFPETSSAYFKRQHRWLRGDLQNFPQIFNKNLSALTKVKLADNVRRAVTPLFSMLLLVYGLAAANGWFFALSIISTLSPFLTGFFPSIIRGRRFSNYRKFYAPVVSQSAQLIRQCVLEVMLLPQNALVSSDALFRAVWRMSVSKRRLLDWTASDKFSSKKGYAHMLWAQVLSLVILGMSVFSLITAALGVSDYEMWVAISGVIVSGFFLSALPTLMYIDKTSGQIPPLVTAGMRKELNAHVKKMWNFYADYVVEEHNFLPPDNVQYAPLYRVCARTSPTNIGMYLLSILSVYYFKIITKKELLTRVENTLTTIEKMEKWKGNLLNWYETKGLSKVSGFVSSVDSGNFLCCILALKEGLKAESGGENLVARIEKIIDDTDLKAFFNENKQLFSIGFDLDKGEMSRHHYDLLMSEARMMSYYAIGKGVADKRHWRSLGRTMGKQGRYAAPIAWTGTMFEYFMPELLLKSKFGGMGYEGLKFALYCQKKRAAAIGIPFGMSESGYYAFDNELNYQYKAHGVGAVGLKEGLDRERVVSPYSSYLAMMSEPVASYNNLTRLEELGACHPKYGFYEAVDFTVSRTGSGYAVIKSHMAHHVGMSIAAVTNTLLDGILCKRFLSDPGMKRAEELLEEKIIAGETLLGEPERQREDESHMNTEEFKHVSIFNPQVTALSNGVITLFCADFGLQETLYKGLNNVRHTADLMNPRGMMYAFSEQEHVMPFYSHPSFDESIRLMPQRVLFKNNTVEYERSYRGLRCAMQVFLHPSKPLEIRKFSAQNSSGIKRQLTLAAFLEPTLARTVDTEAHPAFSDLFTDLSFDSEHQLFIVKKTERNSGGSNLPQKQTFMAIGCKNREDISYSFDRESVLSRNRGIFSAFKKARFRDNNDVCVPSPCLFLKVDFPLDAHAQKETELFFCYGESRDEVIGLAHSHRFEGVQPNDDIVTPIVYDTLYGRIIRKALPFILFTPDVDKKAVMANRMSKDGLFRFGISGDLPLVVFWFKDRAGYIDGALQMKKILSICMVNFDLMVVCENKEQLILTQRIAAELNLENAVHIIIKSEIDQETLTLIRAVSAYQISSNDFLWPEREKSNPGFPPILKCQSRRAAGGKSTVSETGFSEKGDVYYIDKTPDIPWCNLLANSQFGCLVSDCALGFSWALNSRENKLTPWNNDLLSDNKGERLIMKTGGDMYDIIDGAAVEFAPNKADYKSCARQISTHTRIRVFEKGMGKEITVVLSNKAKFQKNISLAFYFEPVLDADRKNAQLLQPSTAENALIFKTHANGVFSGALVVCADREAVFTTERRAFFNGDWKKESLSPSYDVCGAVIVKLELPPKYTDKVKFILAFTKNHEEPLSILEALKKQNFAPPIVAPDIKSTQHSELNHLYKYWLPWQIIGGRMWARTGYYQNSGAFGFRDQLQDALSVITLRPEIAKRQIINAAGAQFPEGDVLHWWHSMMSKRKGVRTKYSDDLLWLPYVLAEYVEKTGDIAILKTQVHYCDASLLSVEEQEKYSQVKKSELKESIYDHAKNALEKAHKKGGHDLLLMGCGDWCDGYNNVGARAKGESVWLSMFYIVTAEKFLSLCDRVHDNYYKEKLEERIRQLREAIDKNAWDGEYYLRAFYDDGTPMGSAANDLCKIDLLPQAFSVFAKMPDEGRKISALTAAIENLVERQTGVVKLFSPAFAREKTAQRPGYVMSYPEGVRENGGQYTHAAAWLALACKQAGMDETAAKITKMLSPIGRGDEYKTEPYYMTADVYTNPQAYGRGGWSIYTGSAGWYFKLLSDEHRRKNYEC